MKINAYECSMLCNGKNPYETPKFDWKDMLIGDWLITILTFISGAYVFELLILSIVNEVFHLGLSDYDMEHKYIYLMHLIVLILIDAILIGLWIYDVVSPHRKMMYRKFNKYIKNEAKKHNEMEKTITIMAANIENGIYKTFDKTLTSSEKNKLIDACRKTLSLIKGMRTQKYVANEVGKKNCFSHFKYDCSLASVLFESADCIRYLKNDDKKNAMYIHNRKFIKEWGCEP